MGFFSLRLMDASDNVTRVFEQNYRDALDALDAAKHFSSEGTIEVWSQNQRIARVKKGDRPAEPEDRISG